MMMRTFELRFAAREIEGRTIEITVATIMSLRRLATFIKGKEIRKREKNRWWEVMRRNEGIDSHLIINRWSCRRL